MRRPYGRHKNNTRCEGGGWEEVDEGSLGGGGGEIERWVAKKWEGGDWEGVGRKWMGGEIGRGESRICQLI